MLCAIEGCMFCQQDVYLLWINTKLTEFVDFCFLFP